MKYFPNIVPGAAAALLMSYTVASAAGMLMDKNNMTLYTFDKDKGGVSACYDECAKNWPPYVATKGEKMMEGWSMVERKDGSLQWAYEGKPLYYFKNDTKAGDAKGDGLKGVWHVIKE